MYVLISMSGMSVFKCGTHVCMYACVYAYMHAPCMRAKEMGKKRDEVKVNKQFIRQTSVLSKSSKRREEWDAVISGQRAMKRS